MLKESFAFLFLCAALYTFQVDTITEFPTTMYGGGSYSAFYRATDGAIYPFYAIVNVSDGMSARNCPGSVCNITSKDFNITVDLVPNITPDNYNIGIVFSANYTVPDPTGSSSGSSPSGGNNNAGGGSSGWAVYSPPIQNNSSVNMDDFLKEVHQPTPLNPNTTIISEGQKPANLPISVQNETGANNETHSAPKIETADNILIWVLIIVGIAIVAIILYYVFR